MRTDGRAAGGTMAERRKRRRRRAAAFASLAVAAVGLAVAACSAPPPLDANGSFVPEAFFQGRSASRGTIVTALVLNERFTADFSGTLVGGRLHLDELFHFSDGDRLQRWDLAPVGGGRYEGTVRTTLGDGTLATAVPVEGYRTAHGAVLDYVGRAPGGGGVPLHFRHVMEAQADGTVLNRVRIAKFAVPLASADVVFFKPPGA